MDRKKESTKSLGNILRNSLKKAKEVFNVKKLYEQEDGIHYNYLNDMKKSAEAIKKFASMLNSKIKERRNKASNLFFYAANTEINLLVGKEEFIKALSSSETNVRRVASRCLEKIAAEENSIAEALPTLISIASDRSENDEETRQLAILAIASSAKAGDDISAAFEVLRQGLHSNYISIRQACSLALYYAAINQKTSKASIKILAEACKSSEDNADYFARGVISELLKKGGENINDAIKDEIGTIS
ncbi:MAG: HEAT repeat domain-containing protein [Candidatus Anstonellales archaeon]